MGEVAAERLLDVSRGGRRHERLVVRKLGHRYDGKDSIRPQRPIVFAAGNESTSKCRATSTRGLGLCLAHVEDRESSNVSVLVNLFNRGVFVCFGEMTFLFLKQDFEIITLGIVQTVTTPSINAWPYLI